MSGHKPYVPIGLSAAEMRERAEQARDEAILTTRCVCGWEHTGTALEGRELAKIHRQLHHPELKPTRRKRASLARWTNKQDDFRRDGMEKAREVADMLAKRDGRAA